MQPNFCRSALPFLLALHLAATPLHSQTNSGGTVIGRITDPDQRAVPEVALTLTDTAAKTVRTTLSNQTGRYAFADVPPGIYDLSVSKPGFAESRIAGQKVEVGQSLTLDVSLALGTAHVVIEVTAGAGLETLNATIGATLEFKSLLALPNLGRDASTLAELQPTVTPIGAVAGAVADQNTFQLDGVNNSGDLDGTMNLYTVSYASNGGPTGVMPTPVESIEEFRVATAGQTADFNASSGGQIMMVTRRGGSQWHGALYEFYFGTNVGAANNWKNNHVPDLLHHLPYTALPASHYNRYGGAAGGPLLPSFWGGKTYIFANFEGFRDALALTYERATPTPLMRLGVIQILTASGYQAYNLNPSPVTYKGNTYAPAICSGGQACDPRGLGLNPLVAQIWNKYMPLPNDPSYGDTVNTQGYLSSVATPEKSAFWATRLDHDFGPRWQFFSSYRYYGFSQLTTSQVDIGGALPGDTFGVPAAQTPRPQKPDSVTAGLTTAIRPGLTNNFHVGYLRNWWQYSSAGAPPQLPGLGGALEIGSETNNALIPYNVNTTSARQRFWDGQDQNYRDDFTWLSRNHILQFGGLYQRNFDHFSRNDNGSNATTSPVYQIEAETGALPSAYIPSNVPSNQYTNWTNLFAGVTGIVAQPTIVYTRAGTQLKLQPQGTPVFDQTVISTYNVYFSDAWNVRPSLTLTYGLGYALELPPYEENGKQEMLVDGNGRAIDGEQYLAARLSAAENGQAYNPVLGFSTVRNASGSPKYPYSVYYGELSPRVSAAWNPRFSGGLPGALFGDRKTVIRGGYSRIFGRMNGVDLVLAPLIGAVLIQSGSCPGLTIQGACAGATATDPVNAFRIGKDGNTAPLPAAAPTLPQPYLPGETQNGTLNPSAGSVTALDPRFRPSRSDVFDFTIQRAISSKVTFEAGYIGRIIRDEFQSVDLDSVDTRLTLNGQTLASAWDNLYNAVNEGLPVSSQPFFEAALGGSGSSYCAGAGNCAAAVAAKLKSNVSAGQVYTVFQNLETQPSWTLGRTFINSPLGSQASAVFLDMSDGWGNYNAGFLSFGVSDFHGLTARSNFTWSKSLGTGTRAQSVSGNSVVDPFNLSASYGPQTWDAKFVYNLALVYETPWLKRRKGALGRAFGGWSIAPLFTAQTGVPLEVGAGSDCQTFGEMNCATGGAAFENAAAAAPYTGGATAHYNVVPSSGPGVGNPGVAGGVTGLNMFANPAAVYAEFRRPVLGQDFNDGGAGVIRGLPTWNLDVALHKEIAINERFGAMLMLQFTNVLNHFQPANPTLNIDQPQTWGVITSQANTPRQMEFGIRVHF